MKIKVLLLFTIISSLVVISGCVRLVEGSDLASFVDNTEAPKIKSHSSAKTRRPPDKVIVDYQKPILEKLNREDFAWISAEASRLRASKERLAGGYWKLRTLYNCIEEPADGDDETDGAWEDVILRLERWAQKDSQSITAKVALASAWMGYGWKARGNGYASTVSEAGWDVFHKRVNKAAKVLEEAKSLKEQCPEFYLEEMRVGVAQGWSRSELDKVFAQGTALEPAYYYLHQLKATYLLPRWGGNEGEWEQFADEAALKLGGNQADIVLFAIYSQMILMHSITFMNTHQQMVPKLIAGFRSIDKLYGASAHRLNEACFFSMFGNDLKTTGELLDRIGDDVDESIWRSREIFQGFRDSLRQRQKMMTTQQQKSAVPTPSKPVKN
jgi:hypothetical protein